MLTTRDYIEAGIRVGLLFLMFYSLKKIVILRNFDPVLAANFLLVLADVINNSILLAHDNLAKHLEYEPFGELGAWLYAWEANFRYFLQMYLYCMIPLFHFILCFRPVVYKNIGHRKTAAYMAVALGCAFVTETCYHLFCACFYYAIPGYYLGIRPERMDSERHFEIFHSLWTIVMLWLLIGTDVAIIVKLYKRKARTQRNSRIIEESRSTASAPPIAFVENGWTNVSWPQPSTTLKIATDKRIAMALFYIASSYIFLTIVFRYPFLFPPSIQSDILLFGFLLDTSKCAVYVLIVVQNK
ncbi:unnamed protein product, partial [Mesorhabditis spiculigera]